MGQPAAVFLWCHQARRSDLATAAALTVQLSEQHTCSIVRDHACPRPVCSDILTMARGATLQALVMNSRIML